MKTSSIAERSFTLRDDRTVTVLLMTPEKVGEEEWLCTFSISGVKVAPPLEARGVDAFQALLLALEKIGTLLRPHAADLSWRFGGKEELGFPRFVPSYFGRRFAEKLEAKIDREIATFTKNAKKKSESKQKQDR
jgi:hypothetical protein